MHKDRGIDTNTIPDAVDRILDVTLYYFTSMLQFRIYSTRYSVSIIQISILLFYLGTKLQGSVRLPTGVRHEHILQSARTV